MNWEAIGAIAEIVAAFAVIASLVYLGFQIRTNTSTVQATAKQAQTDSIIQRSMVIAESGELSNIIRRGDNDFESLSKDEVARYFRYCLATYRSWENSHYQNSKGYLEQDLFEGFDETIRFMAGREGMRQFWQKAKLSFNPGFRQYVDGLLIKKEDA